jgi:hypothetical protein
MQANLIRPVTRLTMVQAATVSESPAAAAGDDCALCAAAAGDGGALCAVAAGDGGALCAARPLPGGCESRCVVTVRRGRGTRSARQAG